jgi:hypothetical protein
VLLRKRYARAPERRLTDTGLAVQQKRAGGRAGTRKVGDLRKLVLAPNDFHHAFG